MRTLRVAVALAGGVLVGATAPAVTAAGDTAGPSPGVLHGEFDPPIYGNVRIHIRSQKRPPVEVEITNAPLQCDDGSVLRLGIRLRAQIKRNGEFRIAKYFPPAVGYNVRRYYDLQGRFVNDRVAKGVYTVMFVSFQPSTPSCATEYPLPWHANR